MVIYLVGGIPTPLKNMRTRQLGYDDSQYMEIWKNNPFMFQTTNQILYTYHHFLNLNGNSLINIYWDLTQQDTARLQSATP